MKTFLMEKMKLIFPIIRKNYLVSSYIVFLSLFIIDSKLHIINPLIFAILAFILFGGAIYSRIQSKTSQINNKKEISYDTATKNSVPKGRIRKLKTNKKQSVSS